LGWSTHGIGEDHVGGLFADHVYGRGNEVSRNAREDGSIDTRRPAVPWTRKSLPSAPRAARSPIAQVPQA
jgi:hypothetical protein